MDRVTAQTIPVGAWVSDVEGCRVDYEFALTRVNVLDGGALVLCGRTVDDELVTVRCAPSAWVDCTLPSVQS